MDWDLAIKRNSKALKGIIEVLFALLGLDGTDAASRIPRSLHSAVLGVLRPAESAVRRLIVIAAAECGGEAGSLAAHAGREGHSEKRWNFNAFLPALRPAQEVQSPRARKFTRLDPRIHFFDSDPRVVALFPAPRPVVEPPPPPDGLVNATRLHRRLQALKSALEDLPAPGQALVRLAAAAEGLERPKFQIAAPARPSSRLPPEAHSRGR